MPCRHILESCLRFEHAPGSHAGGVKHGRREDLRRLTTAASWAQGGVVATGKGTFLFEERRAIGTAELVERHVGSESRRLKSHPLVGGQAQWYIAAEKRRHAAIDRYRLSELRIRD